MPVSHHPHHKKLPSYDQPKPILFQFEQLPLVLEYKPGKKTKEHLSISLSSKFPLYTERPQ